MPCIRYVHIVYFARQTEIGELDRWEGLRSDPLNLTAQAVETIQTKGFERDAQRVLELCRQYETDRVLCGLPLNMDGTLGGQAQKAQDFGRVLEEKQGLTVFYQDERMTTVTADQLEGKLIDIRGIIDQYNGNYQVRVFSLGAITIH